MLVRDGEQSRQPARIFAVCDLRVEQFEDMPLPRLQVELETVAQRVQVTTFQREPVAELLFPAEHVPQGDNRRTDAQCEVDRSNGVLVLPQPSETSLAVLGLHDRNAL